VHVCAVDADTVIHRKGTLFDGLPMRAPPIGEQDSELMGTHLKVWISITQLLLIKTGLTETNLEFQVDLGQAAEPGHPCGVI